ncbi:MAG: hypothetical protein HKP25_15825 [Marinicaulis sp.]|nr:hypothetical protein [Marinicaulis sp.]
MTRVLFILSTAILLATDLRAEEITVAPDDCAVPAETEFLNTGDAEAADLNPYAATGAGFPLIFDVEVGDLPENQRLRAFLPAHSEDGVYIQVPYDLCGE